MIIKLSLALSSNRLQNLALPQPHQPPCPLSVLSDLVTGDSPLSIVYIIPQHSTLFAYSNLNGPLLLPSLISPDVAHQINKFLDWYYIIHCPSKKYQRQGKGLFEYCFPSNINLFLYIFRISVQDKYLLSLLVSVSPSDS